MTMCSMYRAKVRQAVYALEGTRFTWRDVKAKMIELGHVDEGGKCSVPDSAIYRNIEYIRGVLIVDWTARKGEERSIAIYELHLVQPGGAGMGSFPIMAEA
jgi:hypothetical protein